METLRQAILAMSRRVRLQVERAVQGLLQENMAYFNEGIAEAESLDLYAKQIHAFALEALTSFQPVDSEMRTLVSSMNVVRSLDRIADHAVTIARNSRKVVKKGSLREARMIETVFGEALALLDDSILAFVDQNRELALSLGERDRRLEKSCKQISKTLSRMLERQPESAKLILNLIFVVRSLERIAELAVNIGEDVVFIEAAEEISRTS